jgi:hypothetical protein
LKDLRPDRAAIGDAPNYCLGLTYPDRRPKMAFRTVTRLVNLFEGHSITGRAGRAQEFGLDGNSGSTGIRRASFP